MIANNLREDKVSSNFNYKIRPIPLCEGMRDMSQWTYRQNMGQKVNSICYVWYIEGSDPKTLIDAGVQEEHFKNPLARSKTITSLEEGLLSIDVNPNEIKNVIITHLHTDHIALADHLPNATFIVQKKELDYALNPHPISKIDYNHSYYEKLNFRIVDGDTEILPGIKVLFTPGHTLGGQSVLVKTEKGNAIITGFCSQLSTFEPTPFFKENGLEASICGLHLNCREVYDSIIRVKKMADIIIPCHDPYFKSVNSIP
ncbi:MAG: N-acyl homoserine lactonase family protein [Dehalobacterium sp.]